MTVPRHKTRYETPVPGLVPVTHVLNCDETKTWVAGINPATGRKIQDIVK
jgi:hypothetical protein